MKELALMFIAALIFASPFVVGILLYPQDNDSIKIIERGGVR